jgi:hypothetical protein
MKTYLRKPIATCLFTASLLIPQSGCVFFLRPHFHEPAVHGVPPHMEFVPDPACGEPEFFGYHPTCWHPWPEGWIGCPPPHYPVGPGEKVKGEPSATPQPSTKSSSRGENVTPLDAETTGDEDASPSPLPPPSAEARSSRRVRFRFIEHETIPSMKGGFSEP